MFDQDRYFDVVVEYAKGGPDDVLVSIAVTNHGPESAQLDLLPTSWFRNTGQHDGAAPRMPPERS